MQGLNELKNQVNTAKSIMIVTADNPNLDCVASSLALYLSLKNAGKNVVVASNSEPIVRDSHLVGLDKIKTEIGNTNLVISFDHQEDSIEKVSYHVEDSKFNLVVQPKAGFVLDTDKLSFNHTGASADLVIVVGASSIQGAGAILSKEEDLLDSAVIANISNRPGTFGKMNIVDPNSSLAELTTAVIQELALQLTKDAASNLMQGIEDATNGLSSPDMTADTFEALAILYRVGARRSNRNQSASPKPARPIISQKPAQAKKLTSKPPRRPRPAKQSNQSNGDKPSPDWMGPKIYKGSTKV